MTKIQENELSESAVRLQENRKCDIRKSNFETRKFEIRMRPSLNEILMIDRKKVVLQFC